MLYVISRTDVNLLTYVLNLSHLPYTSYTSWGWLLCTPGTKACNSHLHAFSWKTATVLTGPRKERRVGRFYTSSTPLGDMLINFTI